ncbi:MAG TPA: hypothetical protein VLK82_18835 [Candidatus Tectomicrobia bacterium]|nr:hypothetical protein [Candidatus Tectomicrobia bacterium]
MNAPEFRRRVMAQERPGLSKVSLSFAADFFVSQHRLMEGDVRSCIELAGRYEAAYPGMRGDPAASTTSTVPISLGAVLASDRWADELRPSIEKVRQEIFGSPQPPFKTSEEALTALTRTHKGELVEQAAKDLAEATGLSQSAVAAYIVVGIHPFVSSAEIRVQDFTGLLPAGGTFKRTQATIEVNWGELPAKQVKDIRREVRKALNLQEVKRLTEEDQRLLELVKRLDGEPADGKTAFWERVRQEWNRSVGTQQYTTWRGPEMRYRRLRKKLDT